MLEGRVGKIRWRISLLLPALLTVLLLRQPDGMAVSCLCASLLHEGGHLLAMLLLHCPPDVCTIGAFGARLEMGTSRTVGYGRNLLVSLAGPLMNGAAALLFWRLQVWQTAAVHLCLGAFNLLPAAPLDGGQILRCILCLRKQEQQADRLLRIFSVAVLLPMAGAGVWLVLSGRSNPSLLLVSVYLVSLAFAG